MKTKEKIDKLAGITRILIDKLWADDKIDTREYWDLRDEIEKIKESN